ncbi:MAG: glycosyltransferase family 4 protein [Cyclobacteriaceae bacterium]
MKVVFIIPTLTAGGAERVFSLMANFWSEREHDITILSLDSPDHEPFFTLHKNVKYQPLNLLEERKGYLGKVKRTLSQIITTRRRVNKLCPDVVIAQLDIAIFLAMTSTIFSKNKAIVYEGNNPYLNTTNKYLQKFNDFLYRFTDHLVLQTKQIAQTFPVHLRKKISIIYNPVTPPGVQLNHEDYIENFQRKRIVSVGRLEFQKGYDVLIRAFHLFLEDNPSWSLTILGEGNERSKLEELCKQLGITDKVALPGNVRNPHDTLQEASIFVLSSRFEGLPNVLLEAMSIGLPVVATRCKFGPEEIVEQRKNGILVPVDDEHAINTALKELANDAILGEQLGNQAKDILKVCGSEEVMAQWEYTIRKLVKSE